MDTFKYTTETTSTKIAFIKAKDELIQTDIKFIIENFLAFYKWLPKNPTDLNTAEEELQLDNQVVVPLKNAAPLTFVNVGDGINVYQKVLKRTLTKTSGKISGKIMLNAKIIDLQK